MRRDYLVKLSTPIGKRSGKLEVIKEGNQIWGTLKILNHSSPFKGRINIKDECTIVGSFVTLIKTVFYTASGFITDSTVDLKLNDKRNSYLLTGKINQESLQS